MGAVRPEGLPRCKKKHSQALFLNASVGKMTAVKTLDKNLLRKFQGTLGFLNLIWTIFGIFWAIQSRVPWDSYRIVDCCCCCCYCCCGCCGKKQQTLHAFGSGHLRTSSRKSYPLGSPPPFCFGRETSKRKIRTPAPGVLIYNRTMQKENKNPRGWGSYLQGDHAKGK